MSMQATLVAPDLELLEEEAHRILAAGDPQGALQRVLEARSDHLHDRVYHLLLLDCALATGCLQSIPDQWLRDVGEGHPSLMGEIQDRIGHLRGEGRPALAAELAALATELDPWHAPAWYERALCSQALGDRLWALYFCRRSLSVDRDYRPAGKLQERLEDRSGGGRPMSQILDLVRRSLDRGDRQGAARRLGASLQRCRTEQLVEVILDLMAGETERDQGSPH